jgi:hypothetical protein
VQDILLYGGMGMDKSPVKFIAEALFCSYKVGLNMEEIQNRNHASAGDTKQSYPPFSGCAS